MRKLTLGALAVSIIVMLSGCASATTQTQETPVTQETQQSTEAAASDTGSEPKILRAAASFAYPSLDVHKEYYGWYTSIYGVSETLFHLNEYSEAVPKLAEEMTSEGETWTITLNEKAAFSNGTPLTADMVKRNLERAAKVNSRFAYLGNFEIAAVDEHTLTITTPEVYPTLKNDLASPELGIMDLDATTDFDHAPICTGPFVIDSFVPEGDVSVVKNTAYWNGDVQLDGATFYYMQEDEPKLLAMQSGEIDCYNSVSSAALEIYQSEPENYDVVSIPGARLQFYILNERTLGEEVRAAVNLTVDKEAIASYQAGTVSAANGPFAESTAYGQVSIPATDPEAAESLLAAAGYVKGEDGFYAKDGEKLTLSIAYYAARSLDTVALLMQEQLRSVGIDSELRVEEDPDATYIANGDADIALYCMIADKSGDPLYFINSTLAEGAILNCGGFEDSTCQEMIETLYYETDPQKRANLANSIVQIAVDDNAFGYVGLFNNITVLRKGVSGFAENVPYDFYGIDQNTRIDG